MPTAFATASAVLLARSQRGVRLPWASVPLVLAAAAVALGIAVVLPVPVLVQAVVATLIYGVALVLVRRFPPELRTALSARRAGRPAH